MAGPNHIPPKSSKSGRIGRHTKKGNSYRRYLKSVAAAAAEAATPISITHNACVEVNTYMSHVYNTIMSQYEVSKRDDDGYRATRAVRSAKKSKDKAVAKAAELIAQNKILKRQVASAKVSIKESEHKRYMDGKYHRQSEVSTAKEHTEMIAAIEKRHESELANLQDQHDATMEKMNKQFLADVHDARQEVNDLTAKQLLIEEQKLRTKAVGDTKLRSERKIAADKVSKEKARVLRERKQQSAAIDHLKAQWDKELQRNMDKIRRLQDKTLKTQAKKLKLSKAKDVKSLKTEHTATVKQLSKATDALINDHDKEVQKLQNSHQSKEDKWSKERQQYEKRWVHWAYIFTVTFKYCLVTLPYCFIKL